jgi:protein tyrosine phosphatase (PTP) superfamily phosphohydrolase (DUF442 family)
MKKSVVGLILVCTSAMSYSVDEVDPRLAEIINFRQYSESFASSGQPSREQFSVLADKGFERIIYIAFTNNRNALPDADLIVKGLGMEYLHIPVSFDAPLAEEFYVFADSMKRYTAKKTLLHCQVNARATAFSFLYRVIYQGVSIKDAKADMNTVWQPNQDWREFIFAILDENNIEPECDECDWSIAESQN